jgi:branched-chain amino acid transport system permease protein
MKVVKNLSWLIIILFIAVYPITLGKVYPYHIPLLIIVGIYVILATSLDLLVGVTGQISLGHAGFFAIGAYTSGILSTTYHISPLVALGTGLLVTGIVAWVTGWSVLTLKGYYLAMATLGLNVVIYTLIVGFQWLTGGATGLRDIPSFTMFNLTLKTYSQYYYMVWTIVLLIVVSCLAILKSPLGRTLIAIHSDETAASIFGVDCPKYKLHIFVLSSLYASVAGSLLAHYMGFISPDDFSFFTSIRIIVMIYLGGAGTIYGPAVGAIFLKLLPEITYRFHDYELLIEGLILIFVLVFVPGGLFRILIAIKNQFQSIKSTQQKW